MNWPVVNIVVNVAIAVIGFLGVRWLAGLIRIAILELKEELHGTYATKDDLKRVEEKVDLANRLDRVEGLAQTTLIEIRQRNGGMTTGGTVTPLVGAGVTR